MTGALVERALAAELTDHLGHDPGEPAVGGNARNGATPKTLTTEQGEVAIETPRDCNGTFEPQLVKKHQRRFTGFDEKILSMYARGMTVRDIQRICRGVGDGDLADTDLDRHRRGRRRGREVAGATARGGVADCLSTRS